MWVNSKLFQMIVDDNKRQVDQLQQQAANCHAAITVAVEQRQQKAKDDITIDWMRHRINALEKQNAILMGKATGLSFPVPEIVPTRPGTISDTNFDFMPSFEDVGDEQAKKLGIVHTPDGTLEFKDQ